MILARIQETASRHPDEIAIRMKAGEQYRQYTYRDLMRGISSSARELLEQDINRGDRVALLSENRPEWMIGYLAVVSLGAVIVPLDAQLTEEEVSILLAGSEAKAVLVSAACSHKLPQGAPLRVISFDKSDGLSFSAMLKAHANAVLPPAPAPGELAAIIYTSGTTGDPKGVMLSHGNLASNCASLIKLDLIDHRDNLLCLLPLHHSYPSMACMLYPLSLGAAVTILNSLKGPDLLACMQETGVTVMLGVPQLFAGLRRAIFDEIRKKPAALRSLVELLLTLNGLLRKSVHINIGKTVFAQAHSKFGPRFRFFASGGARLEPDVHTDMSSLGFTIIEGYGLTETSPVNSFNPLSKQKAGSIGIALPGVEVKIENPDAHGQGELVVRGPNVMLGYYKKPRETAEVLRDGWFHTGDLGYRDREGYFFITGRSKEMIVLSTGKKIFPEELEKFYKKTPSIKEFCLVQGDRGLEAAVVPDFEYLRKMNLSNSRETISSELEDLARELPPYKRIMGLRIFKDSLPATRLGKLKRSAVRDMYLRGGEGAEQKVHEEDAGLFEDAVGKKFLSCLEQFSTKKKIRPEDNLELDLGLDSLSRVELVVSLEKNFGISLPDSFGSEVFTVKDAVFGIRKLLTEGAVRSDGQVRLSWSEILGQEPSDDARESVRLEAGVLGNTAKYALKALVTIIMKLYGGLTARGLENLPVKGPFIIAPNHLSLADAPAILAALPWDIATQTFSLGHVKFFSGPITSRMGKLAQVIPVDMDARLYSALQLSAYALRSGKVLLVFPEGSRSRDGGIKEFKKGVGIIAKELNIPLIPVAIQGTYEMMPTGRKFPRPGRVRVSFGRPLYPGDRDYDGIVKTLYEEVVKLM